MRRIIQLTILILVFSLSFNVALAGPPTAAQNDEAFLEVAGLGTQASISDVVSAVIKTLLSLLGVIFIVLIVYAGFMWMTSAGNEEQIAKAKKIMGAATIGLAVVLSAYAITYFVIDQVLEATKGGTGLD